MATQLGYGISDIVGSPFDFYTGAVSVAAGTPFQMRNNALVFNPAGAVTIGAITLPQNPADGAVVEISAAVGSATVTFTVAAATNYNGTGSTVTAPITVSDSILGTAATSVAAGATVRYKYTLNGDTRSGANPRTWVRVA
jgi:hypothetical protein